MENSIIFITKAFHHYDIIRSVLEKHHLEYPFFYGSDKEACLEIAQAQVKLGTKAIISTDYLCDYFMSQLEVSVISIRRSGYSFVSSVAEELKHTDKIAIMSRLGGYAFGQAAEEARLINPEQVYTYNYTDEEDAERILKKLKASGFEVVICPSWVGSLVKKYGMKCVYILLPEKDILEAVRQAEFQIKIYKKQRLNDTLISKILNLASEGMAAIDEYGMILDINDQACKILGIHRHELLGKNYKSTVLSIFDQDGELERSHTEEIRRKILTIREQMLIYDVQPVVVDSRLSACVIIFNSAQQIKETERCIRMKEIGCGTVAAAQFSSIIGSSPAISLAIRQARRYAQVDSTVLITAPSGCGKELFAQSIHNASTRASGPFMVINCAALPESVLESLLFGYEPGTFTGGKKEGKAGLFEMAHGGTVFLDEVSEMPLNIQARFLRVLQEREVVRIGGSRNIPIDIRVLAATNRDMWSLVQKGLFREDLYHRISTLLLEIPPLSERKEDIAPLARYFIFKRSGELHLPVSGIGQDALEILSRLDFSGNVRQLNNILERAMVLADSKQICAADIKHSIPRHTLFNGSLKNQALEAPVPMSQKVLATEKESILSALKECGASRTKAAGMLGISTTTLWRRMKAMNLE